MATVKIASRVKLLESTTFRDLRQYARTQDNKNRLSIIFHLDYGGTEDDPACTDVMGVLNLNEEAAEPFRRSVALSTYWDEVEMVPDDVRFEVQVDALSRHYTKPKLGDAYDAVIEHREGMAQFNAWRWIEFQRMLNQWESNRYQDDPPSWNATWQSQDVSAFLGSIGVKRLALVPRNLIMLMPNPRVAVGQATAPDVVEYPSYLRSGAVVRLEEGGVPVTLDHVRQLSTDHGDWAIVRGNDEYGLTWARVLDASVAAQPVRLVQ